MDQRLQFVADHQRGLYVMAELCARYRVSRETGDTWLARYAAEGAAGLRELIQPSPRRQEGST
jgi:putative transposase